MENMHKKTNNELETQLEESEFLYGRKFEASNIRNEILSMSLDEIKDKFPEEYKQYLQIIKTQNILLGFPDIKYNDKDEKKPKINLLQSGARGLAFKINIKDNPRVIKPLESQAEKEIARVASDLGIGPKQYISREGYLHEEFIEGTPLLNLEHHICTPKYMEELGAKFAESLKILHENNILVNDQILTDDFGKSHMIIDKNGKIRIIDFGASINISDFPNISDDAVLSLMRTDPFMQFRLHNFSKLSEIEINSEISEYKKHILSNFRTKKDIINMKDFSLLNEGLHFLNYKLPNVSYFFEGIKKEGL